MTWVLWDILVPLLISFGLGTLLGWMLWRWWWQSSVALDSTALAGGEGSDRQEGVSSENRMHIDEIDAANLVLIQERDTALSELEQVRGESEVLQARVAEFESVSDSRDTHDIGSENGNLVEPTQATGVESKQQSEQITELTQQLEQITVACQEERKVKRELELELLNAKNQYEKLEAQKELPTGSATLEAPDQSLSESDRERADALRAEFEVLEVNHAKLQSALEEQKRSVLSANKTIDDKQTEIAELQASLAVLQKSDDVPSISTEQHRQEISARDVQIGHLKRKLADQSQKHQSQTESKLVRDIPEPVKQTHEPVTEVKPAVVKDESSIATKSGYVPESWTVPDIKPAKKERDELTDIKGVGPVLEKLLHESGIYFFQQVASLDKNGVEELQEQIPQFPNRIRRDQWVKQAKKLHRDKYGAAVAAAVK